MHRIVALCKQNACKRRIGQNEEGEGGELERNNRASFFYACCHSNRIEANAFETRSSPSIDLEISLDSCSKEEKERDGKIVRFNGNEDIRYFTFRSSSRDENSEDSFVFLEEGGGAKLTIEEIRWRSKCY